VTGQSEYKYKPSVVQVKCTRNRSEGFQLLYGINFQKCIYWSQSNKSFDQAVSHCK
ncbi:hypothetical protein BgiBS90_019409, partial [Biomphalaria glabrata]